MQTAKLPRDLWAVLNAPVSEAEAKAQYRAVTGGREPDRMHKDRGWWFMGWLDRDAAVEWGKKQGRKV